MILKKFDGKKGHVIVNGRCANTAEGDKGLYDPLSRTSMRPVFPPAAASTHTL
jgi:hypothetical protein